MAAAVSWSRWSRPCTAGLACLTLLLLAPAAPAGSVEDDRIAGAAAVDLGSDLDWALDAARKSGRLVVAVFGAVWCPYCTRFKEHTLTAPEVRSIAPEFVWVYLDVDLEVGLARKYDVESTPHTLVLRPDGTKVAGAAGAPDGAPFRAFLESARAAAEGSKFFNLDDSESTKLTSTPEGFRSLSVGSSTVG